MEKQAFEAQLPTAVPKLRNTLRKMVGHPAQVDDLTQEALTRAWEHRATFGERASFSTWLCSIGVRAAVDFLRNQKRWRPRAQIVHANECLTQPELMAEIGEGLHDPDGSFDVQEHIAFCFSCVGRSLPPLDQACLVLKDVLEMTSDEGAKALSISESVFRRHLTDARAAMQQEFEGLCSLVNKQGVCYQCKGLREGAPPQSQGPWPPELDVTLPLETRLSLVRNAAIDAGKTQKLHNLSWRRIQKLEDAGQGTEEVDPHCLPPTDG